MIRSIINFQPTIDGILVLLASRSQDSGVTYKRNVIIAHDHFRDWTFSKGYWARSYVEYLEKDLNERVIREYLKNNTYDDNTAAIAN